MAKYKAKVRDSNGNDLELILEGEDPLALGRLLKSKGLTLIELIALELPNTSNIQVNPFDTSRKLETETGQQESFEPNLIDPQYDPALLSSEQKAELKRQILNQRASTPASIAFEPPSDQHPETQPAARTKYTPPAIYEPGPRYINVVPFTARQVEPDEEPTDNVQKTYHSGRALEFDTQAQPRAYSSFYQQDVIEGVYYTGTITTWDKTAALMLPVATLNDLVFFTRQMAMMIRAGLTVDLALASFLSMNISPYIKGVCNLLHQDVTNGQTLANAMRKHPRLFSNHFIGMVRVAEIGGRLEETFELLAQYFEKEREFRQRIMSALMQPGCVFLAMIIVTGLFSYWPMLSMFHKFFRPVFWGLVSFVGVMTAIMIIMSFKHIGGFIRIFLSYLPGIGPYLRKVALSRIAFSLANLLKAGVNVIEAVAMTAPSAFLPQFEYELRMVERRLHQGLTLHQAMQRGWLFPPVVKNLIAVGEATGETDVMLMKIHQYFEEDIAYLQRNFSAVIGPITIVIMGIILLFVLIQFWRGYGEFINTLINSDFFYFGP